MGWGELRLMSAVSAATCSGVWMLRLNRIAEETPRLIRSRSSCGGVVPVKPTASIFAAIRSREDMGLESSGREGRGQIATSPAIARCFRCGSGTNLIARGRRIGKIAGGP